MIPLPQSSLDELAGPPASAFRMPEDSGPQHALNQVLHTIPSWDIRCDEEEITVCVNQQRCRFCCKIIRQPCWQITDVRQYTRVAPISLLSPGLLLPKNLEQALDSLFCHGAPDPDASFSANLDRLQPYLSHLLPWDLVSEAPYSSLAYLQHLYNRYCFNRHISSETRDLLAEGSIPRYHLAALPLLERFPALRSLARSLPGLLLLLAEKVFYNAHWNEDLCQDIEHNLAFGYEGMCAVLGIKVCPDNLQRLRSIQLLNRPLLHAPNKAERQIHAYRDWIPCIHDPPEEAVPIPFPRHLRPPLSEGFLALCYQYPEQLQRWPLWLLQRLNLHSLFFIETANTLPNVLDWPIWWSNADQTPYAPRKILRNFLANLPFLPADWMFADDSECPTCLRIPFHPHSSFQDPGLLRARAYIDSRLTAEEQAQARSMLEADPSQWLQCAADENLSPPIAQVLFLLNRCDIDLNLARNFATPAHLLSQLYPLFSPEIEDNSRWHLEAFLDGRKPVATRDLASESCVRHLRSALKNPTGDSPSFAHSMPTPERLPARFFAHKELLTQCLHHEDPALRIPIARSFAGPALDPVWNQLVQSRFAVCRAALAINPLLPEFCAQRLATDPTWQVRACLAATYADTGLHLLPKLLSDPHPHVRWLASTNPTQAQTVNLTRSLP